MAEYWYSFDDQMKEMFGGKVYRLSLTAGRTCPNRDGTLSTGGCIFCSAGGSGDFAEDADKDVHKQIEDAKKLVSSKIGKNTLFAGYMAYFQAYTSTYGDTGDLAAIFEKAVSHPDIIALSVATRPDCLKDDMIGRLSAINEYKPVFVELGLQTVHEDTAEYINRCYHLPVFVDAVRRLKDRGIRVVAHVIIGLPGEDDGRTKETVRYLSDLTVPDNKGKLCHIDGIKLQLLHVLKGTRLAELLPDECIENCSDGIWTIRLKDGVLLPQYSLEAYARLIRELIEMLPEDMAVHRVTGDAPKKLLILPKWTAEKKRVLNAITAEFRNNIAKKDQHRVNYEGGNDDQRIRKHGL